jgi:hypothetical protein
MRKKKHVPNKETDMNSITGVGVSIQTSPESVPSTPCWLGEVVLIVQHLRKLGVLDAIISRVRFARRVSVLLYPLKVGGFPLLWKDWSRREHRRACIQLVRSQRIEVQLEQCTPPALSSKEVILSRAEPRPLSPFVGRTAGAQCALPNG